MRKIKMMLPVALLLMVTTLLSSCKEVMGWLDNPVSACLSVKVESAALVPGETVDLGATTISTSPIKYATSDKDIATVDENGTVTAVATGSAIITVSVAANETYAAATKQVAITVAGDEALPITLEAVEDGTITIKNWPELTIQYSLNGTAKESFNDKQKVIEVKAGDKVEFYGNNATYRKSWSSTTFACSAKTYIYGNIMSLVDATGFKTNTKLTADRTFNSMFGDWTCAKNLYNHPTKDIVLPATELTNSCYSNMFFKCSSLTRAPKLPATKLASYCYGYMFFECSSLTKAPKLPATELAESCYNAMFELCDKLEEAWVKAAYKVDNYECGYMFYHAGIKGAKLHTQSANVEGWNGATSDDKGNFTAVGDWTD